jgi:subtilisin-like proprotein convertase family protein
MSTQAIGRLLGEPKKVALLLAATLAAVVMLGVVASTASAATFSNNDGITINDPSGHCTDSVIAASPYPSVIAVSGLDPSIQDVNVTLTGLSHSFSEDIGLLLVSPEGQSVILMTDSGGRSTVRDINLTFDDTASDPVPDHTQLVSGTYLPTRGTGGTELEACAAPASFPSPAPESLPASPYGSSLSVFNNTNPNGNWQLYVIDDTGLATGSITGGV